jgi:hypothetical protein
MLNLLFISDSPKVEYIKSVLQPVLKVIIDVVNDFDLGLKDVFEKRPATVCIQDQIGGVTGESVARHIQMLLGNSAPTFILLHTGNGKARAIKGLYEHLVDMSQLKEKVAEEIKNTLKSLLGDQWEKIYIPPKLSSYSVRSSVAVPEESREDADKLIDDFLSDLETSGFSAVDNQPSFTSVPDIVSKKTSGAPQSADPGRLESVSGTVESDRAQSINDDLEEMLLLEGNKGRRDESSAKVSSVFDAESVAVPIDSPKPATAAKKQLTSVVPEPLASIEISSGRTQLKKSAVSTAEKQEIHTAATPVTRPQKHQAPATPAAAEFRISQNALPPVEEYIPEDLLLAFENNYRSESLFLRRSVVIALVCVVCAAGGWYFVKQKPQLISSLKQRFIPSSGAKLAPVMVSAATSVQKPVSPPLLQAVVIPLLPRFIPKDGHDSSYALKNPGWERYVGRHAEFRVFSASGRIQAVQVLAVKEELLTESLIKSVLQEFAGSSEYQITSRNTIAGVRVEGGKIQNKDEVIIYRKNGAVKAFVVSVN